MASGKHSSNEGFDFSSIPWKKIVLVIVIIAVIVSVFFGGKQVYSSFLANGFFNKKEKKDTDEVVVEERIPTNLYGYQVLGELKIEGKNYSGYILNAYDDESLNNTQEDIESSAENNVSEDNDSAEKSSKITDALGKGLVKLYGNRLNEKGNFTIIGHNEDRYFSVLNDLCPGDEFSIKTETNNEKNYIVTEIYEIEPSDLKALMPNSVNTEVTLITCSSGSNTRLVVKAMEETDYEILKSVNIDNNEI